MEYQSQDIKSGKELSELSIKMSYRTGRDNIVDDFYIPCLEASTLYRRAVGYFTSHGLSVAARGVANLAFRKGKMRLVASPRLEPEDVEVLRLATDDPVSVLGKIVARDFSEIEDKLINERLNALAWLSATGMLEIKLAIQTDENGNFKTGIYHEKFGIFSDGSENHVTFIGSSNETRGGLLENFENIKAFCSWKDQEGRVQEDIEYFEALWFQETPNLKVVDFTNIANELLEFYRDKNNPPIEFDQIKDLFPGNERKESYEFPDGFELRKYQDDAIEKWKKAKGIGIFSMATGSGKTLTALTLVTRVSKKYKPLVVIIVCPFLNLCHQWEKELLKFGITPISCFDKRVNWDSKLEREYQRLKAGIIEILTIVTTNATYMGEIFQAKLKSRVTDGGLHHLLIADEVHNLGSKKGIKCLPDQIKMRLGLSATPERENDHVGTEAVLDYFGGVCFEYSMKQALSDGILSPYHYNIILVELTDEEREKYKELTLKIAKLFHGNYNPEQEISGNLENLLIQRARLIANAENKLGALNKVLRDLKTPLRKAIFYCGDGISKNEIGLEERQIKKVTRLLGKEHKKSVRTFTFLESSKEREDIIRGLTNDDLDGVVAIRCLDEGIDLPELSMGFFLASSSNPRQFIQRRGRLLRKAPGKKNAIIYDFIVTPPDFGGEIDDNAFNMERELFRRELKRVAEFCRLAENGPQEINKIKEIRKKYNLISV